MRLINYTYEFKIHCKNDSNRGRGPHYIVILVEQIEMKIFSTVPRNSEFHKEKVIILQLSLYLFRKCVGEEQISDYYQDAFTFLQFKILIELMKNGDLRNHLLSLKDRFVRYKLV